MNVNNKLEYLMQVFVVYFMLFSLFAQLDAKVCLNIYLDLFMVISKTAKQYKSLANPLLIKTDQSFLSLQYFMQVYMFITGVNNISIISVYWGNFLCTSSVT